MATITKRMKWIVKQLQEHPDAKIIEHRDYFMEKSYYTLEWQGGYYYVTEKIRGEMTALKLIELIESHPVHYRGEFKTTERIYGLPK